MPASVEDLHGLILDIHAAPLVETRWLQNLLAGRPITVRLSVGAEGRTVKVQRIARP